MILIESTLDIDRPAEVVFDLVADQTNAPTWQRDLAEVQRLTPGPIGVGTEHLFIRRFAGRRIETRNRFTRYEPGRFVEFEIPDGWLTGRASYLVVPRAPGACTLTSRIAFEVRGPLRVLDPFLRRVMARDIRRDDAVLRDVLESASAQRIGSDRRVAPVDPV